MHDHLGDDVLLGMLGQLGVDAAKPREINFFFILPTESDADKASELLSQRSLAPEKFKVDVPWWKRLFAKPKWLVSVTRHMPLDEAEIKSMTTEFQQIALSCHGHYDGWEANVMGDQIDADQLEKLK
jgi:hypothetical protein